MLIVASHIIFGGYDYRVENFHCAYSNSVTFRLALSSQTRIHNSRVAY